MKILDSTYDLILSHIPKVPPETGGILGGKKQIVSHCVFDDGSGASNGYDIYAPDTELLDRTIRQWADIGIAFYGIFHSHFPSGAALSNGDKQYIAKIMLAMPPHINHLYFPIILPQENMFVYRADRAGQDIHIVSEQIEKIENGGNSNAEENQ